MHIQRIGQLLLLGLAACGSPSSEYDASGNFEADETIISAEGSGKILRFNLEEGQAVKLGEVVGYIDTMQLHLKKKQLIYSIRAVLSRQPDASSQLSTIRKQMETTNYEKNRIERLLKDDAATKKQLDDLTAQAELLERQYASLQTSLGITIKSLQSETYPLQAQVEQLEDQIRKSVIINPIDGTVLTKYVEMSEVAMPGKALYKVANLSNILLRAYLSGDQLSSAKLGQTVRVFVDDKGDERKTYDGILEWVSDKAEFTPKTIQTKDERANLVYAIKVRVKNDGFLKIGMYADVSFQENGQESKSQ